MLSPFNGAPYSAGSGGSSPAQRYPGWVSDVLSKVGLEAFIDEKVEPRDYFDKLTEVAEGESGFVYQAKVVRTVPGSKLTKRGLQPSGVVAIKAVPILPSGSSKLEDLRREVEVMERVSGYPVGASHVLIMEAMYVDLQEDALWIRMELMERSLADVVALVEEGHLERMDEKVVARFASDIVQALSYLHGLGIAHRDVRSDNLLLNRDGVLKIADFSNAVTITPESPACTGDVGVIYWQAPEVRAGSYNPMKADIWSLGATIWEMAESTPPFHDAASAADLRNRWPPLTGAEEFSRSLHDFLILCSNPIASRPDVNVLVQTPFVRSAARRSAVTQILKKCRTIENLLMGGRPSVDSQSTLSRR
ncbi:kinase-like protein [Thelephora ganbajun]|uniref:Kinase-like protein n=1 Tax=Thelephora ganbajun TaxID=370292 RepID=A0ACB6ZKS3_THEGA|nr:kinase-like protein [Thelephora ganbajun]